MLTEQKMQNLTYMQHACQQVNKQGYLVTKQQVLTILDAPVTRNQNGIGSTLDQSRMRKKLINDHITKETIQDKSIR